MSKFSISDLPAGSSVHMIGIGGISMSALAEILINFGYKVTGSDVRDSNLIERLRKNGAQIYIGQSADNIDSPDLVCYTAAISETNPELVKARTLGVPVIERAELLGAVMKKYKYPIAVAGTHGKTTTTSMMALVLLAAQKNPTILVGGELNQINGNYYIGGGEYLPFEACEYVESFLHFEPFVSIITNVEEDHMDFFKDLNHIISSFGKFARLTDKNGCIIVCFDEENAMKVVQNVDRKIIGYAINNKNADYIAENIEIDAYDRPAFDVYHNGEFLVSIKLSVGGEHNILNALAVAAAADFFGIDPAAIKEGLEEFVGAKRRFEKLGSFNGVDVVDDYAHHPTEIKKTIETAKKMPYKNVWVAFQPHTYSRTEAFLENFAEALKLADKVMITDVYAAREKYNGRVHACDLAALIPGSVYMNDMKAMERYIRQNAQPGDLVISMGAGSITELGHALVEKE